MTPPDASRGRHRSDPAILAGLAAGLTIEDTAAEAHVSRSTVQRRLRLPRFRQALADLSAERLDVAAAALAGASGTAVRALSAVLEDLEAPAGARVSAARVLLDAAFRRAAPPSFDDADPYDRVATIATIEARIVELRRPTLADAPDAVGPDDYVLGDR